MKLKTTKYLELSYRKQTNKQTNKPFVQPKNFI